ncbi:MAG: sugar transferase, partial [Bacteroidales bacterium]|nr:sugar transferase [Bacteroidales bacterium]
MKTCEPKMDSNPSYGPFFKMSRVGKGGKLIGVYKLRTMHPYSEYIQNFVVKLNGYDKAGKPRNDFRVTGWGKLFRKIWVDELPQLLNVLKGELGIVGVRPLSQFRFNQLPEDVQKERIKFKP